MIAPFVSIAIWILSYGFGLRDRRNSWAIATRLPDQGLGRSSWGFQDHQGIYP